MTAWVYRCLDSTGAPLYIGYTANIGNRIAGHQSKAPWWCEVANITFERHADAVTAHAAEVAAILAEQPSNNMRHMGTVFVGIEPWTELRDLREQRGMTLARVSGQAMVSAGHLSNLEAGKREPTAHVIRRLAMFFNVPTSTLEKRRRDEVSA